MHTKITQRWYTSQIDKVYKISTQFKRLCAQEPYAVVLTLVTRTGEMR